MLMNQLITKDIADQLDKVNDNFLLGYLSNESNGSFKFQVADPNRKFGTMDKEYVFCQLGEFNSKVTPIQKVEEDGVFSMIFAIPNKNGAQANLSNIETFRRNMSGFVSTINDNNKTYTIAYNTTNFTEDRTPVILNGVEVILISLPIFFKLSEFSIGNQFKYQVNGVEKTFIGINTSKTSAIYGNQLLGDNEANAIVEGTAWTLNATLFLPTDLNDNDNAFEKYLVDYTTSDTVDPSQTFDLTAFGNTRKVLVESCAIDSNIGKTVTLNFTLKNVK